MRIKFVDLRQAIEYILMGNALFTIHGKISGEHITYRVERKPGTPYHIISYKTKWEYDHVGSITDESIFCAYTPTKEKTTAFQFLKTLFELVENGVHDIDYIEIFHHAHCGVCGRKLTHPKSIQLGIGPCCAKK